MPLLDPCRSNFLFQTKRKTRGHFLGARDLDELREPALRERCCIHAYVLMANRVHMLIMEVIAPTDTEAIRLQLQRGYALGPTASEKSHRDPT